VKRFALLALTASLAACVPDPGPTMRPGESCMDCHFANNGPPVWTIAGTVFTSVGAPVSDGVEGAHVSIVDKNGFTFDMRTNEAGNFYSAEAVDFPVQACISRNGQTTCMVAPVTDGSCNICHTVPAPTGQNTGRLFPP
jgi:hypothetical protein